MYISVLLPCWSRSLSSGSPVLRLGKLKHVAIVASLLFVYVSRCLYITLSLPPFVYLSLAGSRSLLRLFGGKTINHVAIVVNPLYSVISFSLLYISFVLFLFSFSHLLSNAGPVMVSVSIPF